MTLISREDAIEVVAQQWLFEASAESPYVNDDDIGEYRNLAEGLFEDVPSADAEWIPCSERLPDVGRDVLFCDSEWTEEGCLRADGDWWQFRWSSVMPKEKVTAWMPLPMPYREESER